MSKHTDQTLAAGGSSPVCDRVLPGLSFVLHKRAVQVTSPRESDGYMGSRECLQGSGGQCSSISPPAPWPLSLRGSLEPHPTRSEYQVEESGHLLKLPLVGHQTYFSLGEPRNGPRSYATAQDWDDLTSLAEPHAARDREAEERMPFCSRNTTVNVQSCKREGKRNGQQVSLNTMH